MANRSMLSRPEYFRLCEWLKTNQERIRKASDATYARIAQLASAELTFTVSERHAYNSCQDLGLVLTKRTRVAGSWTLADLQQRVENLEQLIVRHGMADAKYPLFAPQPETVTNATI